MMILCLEQKIFPKTDSCHIKIEHINLIVQSELGKEMTQWARFRAAKKKLIHVLYASLSFC